MTRSTLWALLPALLLTFSVIGCSDEASKSCKTDDDCSDGYICGGNGCLPVTPEVGAEITSFTAQPESVSPGGSTTLTWAIAEGRQAEITWGEESYEIPKSDLTSGTLEVPDIQEAMDFTLRVTGSNDNSDQATASVQVAIPEPSIVAFEVSPNPVVVGSPTTVTWQVEGANQARLLTGEDVLLYTIPEEEIASGQWRFSPTQATTLKLVVTNAFDQTAESSVMVETLGGAPVIGSFGASRTSIVSGTPVALQWEVEDAETITITDNSGNTVLDAVSDAMGTTNITPTQNATYTLIATNPNGEDRSSVFVEVFEPIIIDSLTATPSEIRVGSDVAIRWTVSGDATTVVLRDGAGNVVDIGPSPKTGSVLVTPTATDTFTLAAGNAAENVSEQVSVTVLPLVPVITTFVATPNPTPVGTPTTLSWETSGATSIQVDDVTNNQPVDVTGLSASNGSVMFTPSAQTTLRLTATNAGGSTTQDLVLDTLVPVEINSFGVDKNVIALGESVTFSWETANTTTIELETGGGLRYNLSPKNRDQDVLTVTPTQNETYIFTANGYQGPLTQVVQVTVVDPSQLLINEVYMNGPAADDGLEWIELYNAGTVAIDLQNFSIGAGGADYTNTTAQLSGVIPPNGCLVVGGPNSSADNGNPTIDLPINFSPDIQNGGATADGVALFFGLATDIIATTVPVDSVLWGTANVNGLLSEAGGADGELNPTPPPGSSIERIDASDVFLERTTPSPNTCAHIESISPSAASNNATGTLEIRGWALDATLDTVSVGTQTLACVAATDGLDCTVATTSDFGPVDVVITRAARSSIIPDGFAFERSLPDPGVSFWCGIQEGGTTSTTAGTALTASVEIYVDGSTNGGGSLPSGWQAEALVFTPGTDPTTLFAPAWIVANKTGNAGNNAVHSADLVSDTPAALEAAFRVTPNGIDYYYCDTITNGGSDDGYSSGLPLTWN